MDLLDGLNESQKKAVLHKDGPLLILAGAGAGKTKAIAHRVAYLVSKGVDPENILAITFTNKAANEMKERIQKLLPIAGYQSSVPFVSTFHSLGVYILRKSGKAVGVNKSFSIFDKEDCLSLIKEVIKDLNMDPKQFQPPKMQAMISRYKGDLITNEDFEIIAGADFFPGTLSKIWNKYEEKLKEQQALDFDDLILKTFLLLKNDKTTCEYYQNYWQYVLIDEYQDTNKSQYELSKILSEKHKNICVIGDIDQAIYGWRGADFRNIINFERDYSNYVSIIFEENYRSTKTILDAAAHVIEKNKMRKAKKLIATKKEGVKISLFEAMNEEDEAEFIAHKIKELFTLGATPADVAILYRANFQSRILEEVCLKHEIPYHVLGVQFYQRKEIKDIFSFIRAAINLQSKVDVKRIINVPPRGIGKTTILNYFSGKESRGEGDNKIKDFLKILEAIKEKIENSKPSDSIKFIIKKTGYEEFLKRGSEDDKERFENLQELVSIATRYDEIGSLEGMEKLLTDAALMSEQDSAERKNNSVRLMTVHSAKGLEFENVFVAGLEEGLFPHRGFGDSGPEKDEEERRLFYVAITRAKEKLFLSFSMSRTVFGARQLNVPSRFISDIPEHLVELGEYDSSTLGEKIIEYL